ncbi:DUF6538 domain-containing protein [Grimontia hollisae]|uniref:DUF6538 domain-containing protein n=1 Tax=Grimontia hollisae TaxID=673 RepID=UPI00165D9E71|nr:DUF6538 domain-containing protein [Grimontia hollisae]
MGVTQEDKILHTYKRKNSDVYQFRLRVPHELKHIYGKADIRFSLNTRDRNEAKKLAAFHTAKYYKEFEQHKANLGVVDHTFLERLSSVAVECANHWLDSQQRFAVNDDSSHFCIGEGISASVDMLYETAQDYACGELSASELLKTRSWSVFAGQLSDADYRAMLELKPKQKGNLYLEFVKTIKKPALQLVHSALNPLSEIEIERPARKETRITLSTLYREFMANKKAECIANGRTLLPKLEGRYQAAYESLAGLVGESKAIADITRQDMRELRDLLIKMPTNHKKLPETRSMSIAKLFDALRDDRINGLPTLSIATINQRIESLSAMFRYAVHENYINVNPAETKGLSLKKKRADKDNRLPYPPELLSRLMTATLGTAHQWTVRLGLYCGMRMNEIVQLRKEDIQLSSDGIWFIDVNEEDGKRVKSSASVRQIPLPDTLLNEGFLSFVDSCKADTLFDIKPSKVTGYRSDVYSKNYRYFCKARGLITERVTFHSLRHNFKDAALEAGVPESAYKQLGGWTEESVSGNYGSGYKLETLKGHIERIAEKVY